MGGRVCVRCGVARRGSRFERHERARSQRALVIANVMAVCMAIVDRAGGFAGSRAYEHRNDAPDALQAYASGTSRAYMTNFLTVRLPGEYTVHKDLRPVDGTRAAYGAGARDVPRQSLGAGRSRRRAAPRRDFPDSARHLPSALMRTCPDCLEQVGDTSATCPKCGTAVPWTMRKAAPGPAPVGESEPTSRGGGGPDGGARFARLSSPRSVRWPRSPRASEVPARAAADGPAPAAADVAVPAAAEVAAPRASEVPAAADVAATDAASPASDVATPNASFRSGRGRRRTGLKIAAVVVAIVALLVGAFFAGAAVFGSDTPSALEPYMHGKGVTFAFAGDPASVRLPATPVVNTDTSGSPDKPVDITTALVSGKKSYEIAFARYESAILSNADERQVDQLLQSGIAGGAQSSGVRVVNESATTIAGAPARAMHGTINGDPVDMVVLYANYKMYSLFVHTKHNSDDVMKEMLASFPRADAAQRRRAFQIHSAGQRRAHFGGANSS